jgi:hypothetical protein
MRALEFNADIVNGLIVLPIKYRNVNLKRSRIIILIEEEISDGIVLEKKERLRKAFLKLQQVNPFRDITDPLEWHKNIRDEWERSLD